MPQATFRADKVLKMAKLSDQIDDLTRLARACDARGLSGRRDRLLLRMASESGLSMGFLTGLRLWQLTYCFEVDSNDAYPYPMRSDRVGVSPKPYTPIGVYADSTFSQIIPLPRSLLRVLRYYLAYFADLENRDSFLFPEVRKNDRPKYSAPITPRGAYKILKRLQAKIDCTSHLDWHVIRRVAVRRYLRDGLSLQEVRFLAGYRDIKSVKMITKDYEPSFNTKAKFWPPRLIGLDFPESVISANVYWYPQELYELGAWEQLS